MCLLTLLLVNSNVSPICYHLREIHNRNVHDLDLDLSNGSMSYTNMPLERPYATFLLLAVAMSSLCATVCEILSVEMRTILTMTFRMDQYQM